VVASGEYDLMILVEGENIDELSEFVTDKLAPKKGVTGTYTHIILAEYKKERHHALRRQKRPVADKPLRKT